MTEGCPKMPIFVLTLERDEARRAPLINALEKFGLDYELFYGVDGRAGLPAHHETQIDRLGGLHQMRRWMSDGEFACALSHRAIYREIEQRGLPHAIILEDDAIIDHRLKAFAELQDFGGAQLVLLIHSHAWVWGRPTRILPGVEARCLALNCCCATGYGVTREGARALGVMLEPVRSVADWPGDLTRLRAVALEPMIVDHPDQLSGASHLRGTRNSVASGLSGPWRGRGLRRFLHGAYWRRWLRKRLSVRIS